LQYGLVAEEVAKVYPGLVASTPDGKAQAVRYQFLTPMLLNEVQKQQRAIEAQAAEIAELRQQIARMAKQLARLERADTIAAAGR
jgi:ubiquinone biosynthesis protein UbiJ